MDDEKFNMILNIIKIIENHSEDRRIMDSCLEIINLWINDFTAEQKSLLLKEFVGMRPGWNEKFEYEAHREEMKSYLGSGAGFFQTYP
ncbi:MAG: hypothetical protein HZB67_00055 [Candidatus Aenigmarchaeota archaeon]|nr:hypothetical protein [Candidatus Aenigmarchaeota archaeon]